MIASWWKLIGQQSSAIQAVCIVLSAIAAFWVLRRNSEISRREKTIEVVHETFFGEEGSTSYREFKQTIKTIEATGHDIGEYYEGGMFHEEKIVDILLRQTNQYELVALGIRKGVFDEAFYKRWFFSQLTRDYAKLFPLITKIREFHTNDAYFCEFERLATRWNRKRHPVKHPPKWKVAWWSLTGQLEKVRRAVAADGDCA